MEHIAAFMLLVGCNADASVCQEIPVPVAAYEDVAECDGALGLQMRLNTGVQERIYGACKAVSEDDFEKSATIEWSISDAGCLVVSFETDPQVVAAR